MYIMFKKTMEFCNKGMQTSQKRSLVKAVDLSGQLGRPKNWAVQLGRHP